MNKCVKFVPEGYLPCTREAGHDGRKLNDSERTDAAIKGAQGKRLFYTAPVGNGAQAVAEAS